MRICKKSKEEKVRFEELRPGDVFYTNYKQVTTYMKIENSTLGTAVDIEAGELYTFLASYEVIPVQGCFYVEG